MYVCTGLTLSMDTNSDEFNLVAINMLFWRFKLAINFIAPHQKWVVFVFCVNNPLSHKGHSFESPSMNNEHAIE